MRRRSYHLFLLVVVVGFLVWSAVKPRDYFTWFLEVAPVLIAMAVLVPTYRRFPLSGLTYTLIAIHSVILIIGGHYTYALTPIGEWMKAWFGFTRNNYDKIGHFAQGFFPALYVREVLVRTSPLRGSKWLPFLVVSVVLAFSAFYELFEWWVSLATGSAGDSFLGTQGYVWDTQSDMFWALIGSILALLSLSALQDRLLKKRHDLSGAP